MKEKKFLEEVIKENKKIDNELKKAGFTRRSKYFHKYIAVDSSGYPKRNISFKIYIHHRLDGESSRNIFSTAIVTLPKKKKTKKVFGPAMTLWGVSKLKGKKAAEKLWKERHTK